jgi:CRISPR/Cas system-associated exonuclease Cas4 (RecB family)
MKPIKISYSQLISYDFCPKKYEFCYILKIPQKIHKAASFGTVIHNTLYRFYQKIEEHDNTQSLFEEYNPDISYKSLLQIYDQNWSSHGYTSKQEEAERKKQGESFLQIFFQKHSHNFKSPLYLEKPFKIHLENFYITGRIDRIDSVEGNSLNCKIIDYKTGKLQTQEDVDQNLQLSIYTMAAQEYLGLKVDSLSLYFLEHDRELITHRSKTDLKNTEKFILNIARNIQNKEFPAKPNKEKCKYCDYKNRCKDSKII